MRDAMVLPTLDSLAIAAWEITAQNVPAEEQASQLIACLFPGMEPETPGAWTLGKRNAVLLSARMQLLGAEMQAVAPCPRCQTAMEITLPGAEMLAAAPPWEGAQTSATIVEGDWQITLRLPTGDDLAFLARRSAQTGEADDESAAWLLLQRCTESVVSPVDAATGDGEFIWDWPVEMVAAASEALVLADPLAEMLLNVRCDRCGHVWDAPFDAAGFFLVELRAHGERVLDTVHQIASVYGWTEREILALSPFRRAAYLSRIENG